MEKSDVGGSSGFDCDAQMLRMRGVTVLVVMVYMTNGVAEPNENSPILWELVNLTRSNDLPFICMGDWNMTPEEMEKTVDCSSAW